MKLGPTAEIRAEADRWAQAKTYVSPPNIANKIAEYEDGDDAVLLLEFANYAGRPPIELESALKRVDGFEAFAATVKLAASWSKPISWKSCNVTSVLKQWVQAKLERLPDLIKATVSFPVIYSPDFGEAYSNPAFYLQKDIKRIDAQAPYGFTHGDFNLRNVLFARDTQSSVDTSHPVAIDFRHAGTDQWSLTDLAKLEACLRYGELKPIDGFASLNQVTAFLAATRGSINLVSFPEVCTDKHLQELWRCIKVVREKVSPTFSENPDSEVIYWILLCSYGITAATYDQLKVETRHLAYLDAAALFTRVIQSREPQGRQSVLPVHSDHSPPVVATESTTPITSAQQSLFNRAIVRRQAILVAGPSFGRAEGVEPFTAFTQRLYKEMTLADPPLATPSILFEALQKRKPRQEILKGITSRISRVSTPKDSVFAKLPWTGVLGYHFHDLPLRALRATRGEEFLRVSNQEDALQHTDAIAAGSRFYLPIHGDIQSRPHDLVLSSTDRRARERVVSTIARALERRQTALALVFWKCEELSIEEIARMRDDLCAGLAVSIDCFFLTDQDDNVRDASLHALEVWRVNRSMTDVVATLAAQDPGQGTLLDTTHQWQADGKDFVFPDVARLSRGLLRIFEDRLTPDVNSSVGASDFLLGAPASTADITDGRVVKRSFVDDQLLPRIRASLAERNREPKALLVTGRAGSGVSTMLCYAAYTLSKDGTAPVVVVDSRTSRARKEWRDAGTLVAELSNIAAGPVVIFVEASYASFDEISELVRGAFEGGGRAVVVIGGRKEVLAGNVSAAARAMFCDELTVHDQMSLLEWDALARIIKRYGYSASRSVDELAARMKAVGRLLPAIYEATDKLNRKFKEIVAFTYEFYGKDQRVQRAYRLICTIGAFDVPISQYWLLKALGSSSLSDAPQILGALADDIVVQQEKADARGDIMVSPVHRIVAEEVVEIASPELSSRLLDIATLIETANLASQSQGMSVAKLLHNKGPLVHWVEHASPSPAEAERRIGKLFDVALSNDPIHPNVEVHLRQHYALLLRKCGRLDVALDHAIRARELERDNPATLHILGLVYEQRALAAWRSFIHTNDAQAMARARSDETEALAFFRECRDAKPYQEHGYESEARYYRRKREALDRPGVPATLAEESHIQVFQGLALIRAAEAKVPKEALRECGRTKALLTQMAGDSQHALDSLLSLRRSEPDPVRRMRLTRAAATVAAEASIWDKAYDLLHELIESGERDPVLYLDRDNALQALGKSSRDRAILFRDSAEEFNRRDIETLIRWAGLCLGENSFTQAIEALRRADDVAQTHCNFYERERIRGTLTSDQGVTRFHGRVERMSRNGDGYVTLGNKDRSICFRGGSRQGSRFEIGAAVKYSIAWRIRGLRAVDVELDNG